MRSVRVEERDCLRSPSSQGRCERLDQLIGIAYANVDFSIAEFLLKRLQELDAGSIGVEKIVRMKRSADAQRPAR